MRNITILLIITAAIALTNCTSKTNKQNTISDPYALQLDTLMQTAHERGLLNGNVLVLKKNQIVYEKSFGYSSADKVEKLNKQSIFNIGSIAKEFNGVALLMLQEQGLLNINDTLSKFELGLPAWEKRISIQHLLNYSSGLPQIDIIAPSNDEEAWEILRQNDTLLFEPGTDFLYDNANVFLQKRIIEQVTGQSFEEFVIQNILQPLNMGNTLFDPASSAPNRTSCFNLEQKPCPKFEFISGWPWMTATDLSHWIHALNTNKLISQDSYNQLKVNPYVDNKTSSLGEYFEKIQLQRHNGVSLSFESIMLNDKKNDVVIIILSNQRNRVWNLGHEALNIMQDSAYSVPQKSIRYAIQKECLENVTKGIAKYHELKQDHTEEYSFDNPSELNKLGYDLIRADKVKDALKIFELAITVFPRNANLYDSYGEALFFDKQYEQSLSNYQQSLTLNPKNKNAEKMIEKIRKIN